MKTIRISSRAGSFVSAIVILLVLQISPALADKGGDQRRGPVEITFTKWILPDSPLMEGFVGGDVTGEFTGEVLQYQPSLNGRITRLEAMYEVQAGNRSFTALIRGGTNARGRGILDGVILDGWRRGARVHVAFDALTDCPGAPAGTCFKGMIEIDRASRD